jgi:hypothetical protein
VMSTRAWARSLTEPGPYRSDAFMDVADVTFLATVQRAVRRAAALHAQVRAVRILRCGAGLAGQPRRHKTHGGGEVAAPQCRCCAGRRRCVVVAAASAVSTRGGNSRRGMAAAVAGADWRSGL